MRKYSIRLQLIGIKCPSPRVSENIQCQTLSELVHSQEDDAESESCGEAKPKQEPGEMPVAQEEQTKVGGERERERQVLPVMGEIPRSVGNGHRRLVHLIRKEEQVVWRRRRSRNWGFES